MRLAVSILFLVLQIGVMLYGLLVPKTPFRWAPFDIQAEYWISVEVEGRSLTEVEIEQRYREPAVAVEQHAIEHLFSLIRGYEQTYGRHDQAEVLVRYRLNGGEIQEWRWPAPQ